MTKTKESTLEAQIAALQEQINFLMGSHLISPAKQLQSIRSECRTRYFGTWNEMCHGEVQYGPEGKRYSDYDAIMEIVNKATGLLFKYTKGKSNGGTVITSLVKSDEDAKEYKAICEAVCRSLRQAIDEYSNCTVIESKEQTG